MARADGSDRWEAPPRPRGRRAVWLALIAGLAAAVVLTRLAGAGGDLAVGGPPTEPSGGVDDPDADAPGRTRAGGQRTGPPDGAAGERSGTGGVWIARSDAPLPVPGMHAGVWTGDTFIAWGGDGQAAAYGLRERRWRRLDGPPLEPRLGPALSWTGRQVLVWGGERRDGAAARDGAALDPRTGRWDRLPDAPVALRRPVAAWTGDELLVWGMRDDGSPAGAALDPASGRWRTLAAVPVGLRGRVAGQWAGEQLLVWGRDRHGRPTAAAYAPRDDRWRALPRPPLAYPERTAAAWTGRELVLWGRPLVGRERPAEPPQGAALDPAGERWRLLPLAPGYDRPGTRRGVHGLEATWTGERVIVIGGYPSSVALAYDPAADQWEALPDLPGLLDPVVVWTGPFHSAAGVLRRGELLVWGGYGPYGPTVGLSSWRTVGLGPTSDARLTTN